MRQTQSGSHSVRSAARKARRSRRVVGVGVFALIVLTVAGCERARPPAASAADGLTDRTASVVRIGYFANLTHAQAVLAVETGDFAAAVRPATLRTQVFNAGPSLIEALFAGEIDIGYVGPGPALNAHARTRGAGIHVVAGAAANGVAIVARPDAGIRTLADLKGKRIATPQLGNTQDLSARHYLRNVLAQPDVNNVTPIPNAEQLAMMTRERIDAVWAPEPWAARLIVEGGGVLVAEEKDLWPERRFCLALVVTTPEFLARHADVLRRVLQVHMQWTKQLNSDRAACAAPLAAAINKLTGKSLPPKVFEDALARTEFLTDPLEDSLREFAQWSYDLEFSKSPPNVSGLVDTRLLRELE
ncbi:MAG: aliphatic sulfonate ABC transporter substrate-binding protein [Phycisphaerae bacterium]